MKRYIKYSFSLAVALVILGTSKNSYAIFPTFDVTSFKERFEGTMQTIKSYGKVKEATETASDINNSVGSASKSMGELGVDDVKKAKEKKDKLEKAKETYEKTKKQVEKRKKQLEKKKEEIEAAKAKVEAVKKDADKIKSDYDKTVSDVNKFKSDVEETKGKIEEYKDKADSVLGTSTAEEDSQVISSTTSNDVVSSSVSGSDSSSTVKDTSIGRKPFATVNDNSVAVTENEEMDDSKYKLSEEEIQKIADEETKLEEAAKEAESKDELTQEEVGKGALEEAEARLQLLKETQGEGASLSIGEKALAEEKKRIEEIQKLKEESKSINQNVNGSRRKPFGKTSYRNSESLVFAKLGSGVLEEAEKRAQELASMHGTAAAQEEKKRRESSSTIIKPSTTASEEEVARRSSSPGTLITPSGTALEVEKIRNNPTSSEKGSSYYKSSERLAFADVTSVASDSTDGPTGITDEGIFILSEEAAIYCDLNVNKDLGEGSEKMKECIVKVLTDMSSDNPSAAADGQKKYTEILREQVIGTLAENMRMNNEAAQFNSAVLEPLSEDIGGATNTRDDVSTLSLTNKEAVYVLNRLTFSSSLQLTLDALKQVGYFNIKDMETIEDSSDTAKSSDKTSTDDTSGSSKE